MNFNPTAAAVTACFALIIFWVATMLLPKEFKLLYHDTKKAFLKAWGWELVKYLMWLAMLAYIGVEYFILK